MSTSLYTVSHYLRDFGLEFAQDAEDLTWQDAALCAETDPEAFFPEKGRPTRPAKQVCRACPVRAECLADALEHMGLHEYGTHGVWGGLSSEEREAAAAEYEQGIPLDRIIIAADVSWHARPAAAAERNRERDRKYAAANRAAVAALTASTPQPREAA